MKQNRAYMYQKCTEVKAVGVVGAHSVHGKGVEPQGITVKFAIETKALEASR